MEIEVNNVDETLALATLIGELAEPGMVIVLSGDLGAGKTTFTKGIAVGLGIHQMIKSPTYTIIREYQQGRIPLYHMDVYRIGEGADDLGLDEYFAGDGLSVVEWGELIKEELPPEYVEIQLLKNSDSLDTRSVVFRGIGTNGQKEVNKIQQYWRDKHV